MSVTPKTGRTASDPFVAPTQQATAGATSAFATGSHGAAQDATEGQGTRIGPYRLVQKIGEGGMGEVWVAEQTGEITRRVAVKLIKAGMDSQAVVARFEAERQAVARMDHPNIARVFDAGTTDAGRPYFAMELVAGVPFARYCDDKALDLKGRLELFVPLCRAIQHAHQKGIIHRDIKPSNVLVAEVDGTAVPKVIDFGIAKATDHQLTDHTLRTQAGMPIGTFEYMAPEQADGGANLEVDTRADIYSLGVLLYELLTGTTPHESAPLRAAGLVAAVRMIRETDPPRPSGRLTATGPPPEVAAARQVDPAARLPKLVRAELDWIVMRCLEKNPSRRYQSADALAEDIGNYLADRPVNACPPSFAYRARKFARKNRGWLAAAALLLVALVAGVAVSTRQAVLANRAKEELRDSMTRQVAERIEGDLGRFAAVGDALGATALRRTDWTEAELGEWMEEMLTKEPQVFGLTLAYEPGAIPWKTGDHLYKCRTGTRKDTVMTKVLVYPKGLHAEKWYLLAKTGKRSAWTEPFLDTGSADFPPMVCHVAPMTRVEKTGGETKRDKTFIGVLTVDLSLTYFDRLRGWLKDLDFGEGSYGFVVARDGTVLSHPDPDLDFGRRADAGQKTPGKLPEFAELGPGGRLRATDPSTDRPATFLYSRIRLDRNGGEMIVADQDWWTFVVSIPD